MIFPIAGDRRCSAALAVEVEVVVVVEAEGGGGGGGFVLDVEDASNFSELVSKRDGPVTFLQMQPIPAKSDGHEGFRASHPLLLVVAGDETNSSCLGQNRSHLSGLARDTNLEFQSGNCVNSPTAVRFYSLESHCYEHVLRFRCSPRIVAVGLTTQIYCFDALTLENKFSVLTYPVPQLGGQGTIGVNIGYGPMAVSPRFHPVQAGKLAGLQQQKQIMQGWLLLRTLFPELLYHNSELIPVQYLRYVLTQVGPFWLPPQYMGITLMSSGLCHLATRSGSGTQSYDWSSSHVHLYKLYRGITTAIIQDICFSHYSQWIAIVSSKGTCHIFVLSPFGGDAGFQTLNSQVEEPSLFPSMSLPWWSTSSCIINEQSYPPPAPVALSVVSRIRNSNSGWLNTVSNAAASATGKVSVPSGAVAAVFHNSLSRSLQHVNTKVNTLEHLLVYTPSGHVIQHELLPSIGAEPSDSASRIRSGSLVQIQDEELRVKVEPVQWWDVCRRSDWPEREECISVATLDRQEAAELIPDKLDWEDIDGTDFLETGNNVREKKLVNNDLVKPHERSNWYLSNAEVQISSVRLPTWQKSKICFYMMDPPRVHSFGGGEFEIERVPVHEVEIRRKDLLPVFDHFHSIKSGWNDRGLAGGRYPLTSDSEPHQAKGKFTEETVICHSKPASLSSTESSDGGSSRRIENLLDLDQIHSEKSDPPNCQIPDEFYQERIRSSIVEPSILSLKSLTTASMPSDLSKNNDSHIDHCFKNGLSSLEPSAGRAMADRVPSSNSGVLSEVSMLNADHFDTTINADHLDSTMNALAMGHTPPTLHNPVDFGQCFQEEYCKASDLNGSCRSDVGSGNCEREKLGEDGENDEMFGGMFAFSEEG
ncbi:hypothetical protein L1049_005048 [Liquidambar formosana]|uniref:BCAS3 domain-containing protein n=1 Tax=Liquidambar formosana TaxID=63359 RepID=A0AAP0RUT6_LIQFO